MGMEHYNFLLINRKPQRFQEVLLGQKGLILRNQDGSVLNHGILVINQYVRACLYCDEVRNLTFLLAKPDDYAIVTLIFAEEEQYEEVRDGIAKAYPALQRSPQNKKLNRYAERLMEKLRTGNEIRIVDEVRKEDVVICPECGVQCAPGTPYCMECGAELPQN